MSASQTDTSSPVAQAPAFPLTNDRQYCVKLVPNKNLWRLTRQITYVILFPFGSFLVCVGLALIWPPLGDLLAGLWAAFWGLLIAVLLLVLLALPFALKMKDLLAKLLHDETWETSRAFVGAFVISFSGILMYMAWRLNWYFAVESQEVASVGEYLLFLVRSLLPDFIVSVDSFPVVLVASGELSEWVLVAVRFAMPFALMWGCVYEYVQWKRERVLAGSLEELERHVTSQHTDQFQVHVLGDLELVGEALTYKPAVFAAYCQKVLSSDSAKSDKAGESSSEATAATANPTAESSEPTLPPPDAEPATTQHVAP